MREILPLPAQFRFGSRTLADRTSARGRDFPPGGDQPRAEPESSRKACASLVVFICNCGIRA